LDLISFNSSVEIYCRNRLSGISIFLIFLISTVLKLVFFIIFIYSSLSKAPEMHPAYRDATYLSSLFKLPVVTISEIEK